MKKSLLTRGGWKLLIAALALALLIAAFALRDSTMMAPCGVEILRVHPNTPAEAASLKKGDAIIGFNGEIIRDFGALDEAMEETGPGDPAEILYQRGKEFGIVNITLAAHPEEPGRGYIGVQITTRFTEDPTSCYKMG